MRSNLISARFAGKCRACGKPVQVGNPVYFAKHYGVRCSACGPHLADEKPLPPKKGSKRFDREHVQEIPPRDPKQTRITRGDGPQFTSSARTMIPDYTPADPRTRMTAQQGPDGITRMTFECITDVLQDAVADYASGDAARNVGLLASTYSSHKGSEWANYYDHAKLLKAVSNPKGELIEAIEEMRAQLMDDLALPTTPRRRVRRGLDWGDELDPDRYLARDPQGWTRMIRENHPARTVTIGVNLTVHCAQRASELLYRGAAACALADVLQQRGLNVRIIGISVGGECSTTAKKLVTTVQLKASDMPLDTAALATALCDIGFYRMGLLFAEARHLDGRVASTLGYRGADQYLPGPDRTGIDYLVEHRVRTRQDATDWLKEQLTRTEDGELIEA